MSEATLCGHNLFLENLESNLGVAGRDEHEGQEKRFYEQKKLDVYKV